MRIIAVANQKGGVGKTITAVNLSAALAMANKRVLLVDLDSQANASIILRVDIWRQFDSIYDVLVDPYKGLSSIILDTHIKGLYLAPSNLNLASAEIDLVDKTGREVALRNKIERNNSFFDYCIVDCGPSLGLLTVNALTTAEEVFIPLQMGYLALEGVQQLMLIINLVKEELENRELRISGVIPTFFDADSKLCREVLRKTRDFFGNLVFETIVERCVELDEAASHHKTIFEYAPDSTGAQAYKALAMEVMKNG